MRQSCQPQDPATRMPPEIPPRVQGILLGLLFGLVLFGDAIIQWLGG